MWGNILLRSWFAFPWWLVMLNIFSYACWPSIYSLQKIVYSSTLPIFLIGFFFCYWIICVFFIYFGYKPLTRYLICKYLPLFGRLPSHFVDGFHRCAKVLWFDVVLLIYFCFCCLCFWRKIQKVTSSNVKIITTYLFFQRFYGFRFYTQFFNPLWVSFGVECKIVGQFHSFACGCPVLAKPFIKKTVLALLYIPWLFWHSWPYVCRFISGLFTMFQWSMCMSLCQYYTSLISLAF